MTTSRNYGFKITVLLSEGDSTLLIRVRGVGTAVSVVRWLNCRQ
jgi:hypothetical protein